MNTPPDWLAAFDKPKPYSLEDPVLNVFDGDGALTDHMNDHRPFETAMIFPTRLAEAQPAMHGTMVDWVPIIISLFALFLSALALHQSRSARHETRFLDIQNKLSRAIAILVECEICLSSIIFEMDTIDTSNMDEEELELCKRNREEAAEHHANARRLIAIDTEIMERIRKAGISDRKKLGDLGFLSHVETKEADARSILLRAKAIENGISRFPKIHEAEK